MTRRYIPGISSKRLRPTKVEQPFVALRAFTPELLREFEVFMNTRNSTNGPEDTNSRFARLIADDRRQQESAAGVNSPPPDWWRYHLSDGDEQRSELRNALLAPLGGNPSPYNADGTWRTNAAGARVRIREETRFVDEPVNRTTGAIRPNPEACQRIVTAVNAAMIAFGGRPERIAMTRWVAAHIDYFVSMRPAIVVLHLAMGIPVVFKADDARASDYTIELYSSRQPTMVLDSGIRRP